MLGLIFGYLIISILIGIYQYRIMGELSGTYLTTQWVIFIVSAICTLKFQNSPTVIGDFIATISGGFAMMIIIQAVIFFILGDIIASKLSITKIILLIIFGALIARFIYKYLVRNPII